MTNKIPVTQDVWTVLQTALEAARENKRLTAPTPGQDPSSEHIRWNDQVQKLLELTERLEGSSDVSCETLHAGIAVAIRKQDGDTAYFMICLLYTSPSPRDV